MYEIEGLGFLLWYLITAIVSLVTSVYGAYAVYYGYFKKKDEREKYIVSESATQAFFASLVFFFVYYITAIAIASAGVTQLEGLPFYIQLSNFSAGSAVSWMMLIFTICLLRNRKK